MPLLLNTIQCAFIIPRLIPKNGLVPTELGMTVTKMLVENLPKIMDIKFTAHMEEDLDKIAQGELDRDTSIAEFYETFQKDLKEFKGEDGKTNVPNLRTSPALNVTKESWPFALEKPVNS